MYQVSQAFAAAAASAVQIQHIRGTIGVISFDDNDLLAGSLVITNQCADSTNVAFGSVYVGELKCTFLDSVSELIGRRTWTGLDITIEYGLTLEDQSVEYIPIGLFRITEATHSSVGVTVRAYDRMSFFDDVCGIDTTSGTPYELARLACETCGVTLGMIADDFEDLVNGTGDYTCATGSSKSTWRDFIGYLAAALGCFASIDRAGELYFRPLVPGDPVDVIDRSGRFRGGSFSDYSLAYGAIEISIIDGGAKKLYVNGEDGLTMDLKDNPFLQDNSWETRRQALADYAAGIISTPFTVTLLGSPAYDLGDTISFVDGIADDDAIYTIHRFEFKYKKGYKISGFGKNPALTNAKTADEKQLSHVAASNAGKGVVFYPFTNGSEITVRNQAGKTNILTITVVSTDTTYVMLEGQAVIETELVDESNFMHVNLTYYIDGEEILTIHPEWTWSEEGKQTITFMYPVIVSGEAMHRFQVAIELSNGNCTIAQGNVRAVVWGQNLAATQLWDGLIEIEDVVGVLEWTPVPMTLAEISDATGFNIITDLPIRIGDEITEPVGYIELDSGVTLAEISDYVMFGKNIRNLTWGQIKQTLTWQDLKDDYHW